VPDSQAPSAGNATPTSTANDPDRKATDKTASDGTADSRSAKAAALEPLDPTANDDLGFGKGQADFGDRSSAEFGQRVVDASDDDLDAFGRGRVSARDGDEAPVFREELVDGAGISDGSGLRGFELGDTFVDSDATIEIADQLEDSRLDLIETKPEVADAPADKEADDGGAEAG
jgi:hypothetical protein